MGRSSENRLEGGAAAEFFREASIHLGISQERLRTAVSASQSLSKDELQVVASLLELVRTGAPLKRRTALSRGIVSAIKTVQESAHDPLAVVDEPMEARVFHMYVDILGLVSTGLGNLIDPVGMATSLPWRRLDGSLATREEIVAAWHKVKTKANPLAGAQ